jgi:hypothetical protein
MLDLLARAHRSGDGARTIGGNRNVRVFVTFPQCAQLLARTVVPYEPGLRRRLSRPVDQFAVGRSGESAEPEQRVKRDLVRDRNGSSGLCALPRMERLRDQVAVARVDQASIGIGGIAADVQKCVIFLSVR